MYCLKCIIKVVHVSIFQAFRSIFLWQNSLDLQSKTCVTAIYFYYKEPEILHLCITEESHNLFERAVESESDERMFIIVSLKWFKYNHKLRTVKQKHLLLSKKTIRTHSLSIQRVLQQSNLIKTIDKYTAKTFSVPLNSQISIFTTSSSMYEREEE